MKQLAISSSQRKETNSELLFQVRARAPEASPFDGMCAHHI